MTMNILEKLGLIRPAKSGAEGQAVTIGVVPIGQQIERVEARIQRMEEQQVRQKKNGKATLKSRRLAKKSIATKEALLTYLKLEAE